MMLGFNSVRSMCLSYALIESLLKGKQRERALKEMARSFHAAVQAKQLASLSKDKIPEEVFIAALLCRLGQIAFWCFAGDLADRLDNAMKRQGVTQEQAEEEILGFRLSELTRTLSKEWHLSPLLEDALDARMASDPRVRSIAIAHQLAVNVEQGWDSPKVKQLIKKASEVMKVPAEKLTKMLHSGAKDAADIAEKYGMPRASRLIPMPYDEVVVETAAGTELAESPFPEPDRLLQLKILHELSTMLLGKQLDINGLFSILLEGIFRGIGMDRVLFSMMTSDRRYLRGKYGLGMPQTLVKNFFVEADPDEPNIFSSTLKTQQPIWVQNPPQKELARLLTPDIRKFVRNSAFFMMPIVLKSMSIGIVYADRHQSGRELDEESFTSFKYFGQQANLCLTSFGS